MESVIYDYTKTIIGAEGKDYTHLLTLYPYHFPDIQNFKVIHKVDSQIITLPNGNSLFFDSKFESGNLAKVNKIDTYTYHLFLRQDDTEKKDKQWYYFAVYNSHIGNQIR